MLGFAIAPVAPAPPVPVRPSWLKRLGSRLARAATRAVSVKIRHALFYVTIGMPVLACQCAYWAFNNTRQGRQRYHLRAAWAAVASLYVAPWTPWAWIGLAAVFDAWHCWREPSRWISAREQRVLARGCALAAGWAVLALDVDLPWAWTHMDAGLFACDVPWSWGVPIWLPLAVAAVWPWSKERRIRPDVAPVEEIHPLVEQWHDEVSTHPKAGPLAFTELRHDPASGRFHLRAPIDGEDGVEGAAERACRLMCRPRGTVTISPAPNEHPWDANDFFVALTSREDPAVVRYLTPGDLDSIDRDGSFITGHTADGRPILGALRGPSGAAHALMLAPSRYGKGFVMRQYGIALARSDKAFLNIADCKGEDEGGAGVPELRHGADVYGWTRDEWRACVEMHHELFSARAGRYGRAGRNFYNPDAVVDGCTDPLAVLMIDEMRKMYKAWGGAVVRKLEDMASQGASFGISLIVNTQKGDADSLGSTTLANDLRGNGTVYIGRYEHAQAARDAVQGFNVDPQKLPDAKGWWYVKSAFHPTPLVPIRTGVLATSDEVEFMGFDKPHGTTEDWLAGARAAKLHPEDQEIVEKWRGWMAGGMPMTANGAPDFAPFLSGASVTVEPEPVRESVTITEPVPGVHVESSPRLHLVPAQSGSRTARELIPDVLRTAGRAMTRGEIAEIIGQKPNYVSGLLKEMEGKAVKRAITPKGEPGWTVAA